MDERQSSGQKIIRWDGRDESSLQVGSGIYIYRLEAGDLARSRKILFLK